MPLFRMQKSFFLVAFISSLILSMTACSTALDKKDPPSEQIPDKQLSYTFAEVRVEFPSSLWKLVAEGEYEIVFSRPYKTGFGNALTILVGDVYSKGWGFTREQHIKNYFNYERNLKLRPQDMEWSGFVEGTMEIDGVHYPIMRYSNIKNGTQSDGLFMILFPDDLEKRHRFYALMFDDIHPEGTPAPGFPDLEFIVKNLEILPVVVSSDSNSVIDGDDTEDMARPGHPGWVAAEESGCLVWNEAPAAGVTVAWSGSCKGNRATGQGKVVWRQAGAAEQAQYVGEMRDGKASGRGTTVWANGSRYEGDWIDNKRTGRGTYRSANGDIYEGYFVDGKQNGRGIFEGANGDIYEGDFVNGKQNGRGIFVWASGDRYEGDFVDDKFSGRGTLVGVNGNRFEGDFANDNLNGRGIAVFANGNRYEGYFVDGRFSSRGKMTKVNGDWYDGEWSGGYADGEGKAKINGKKYKGVWARGCLRSMEQRTAWDVPHNQCP